jgi:hypothetical protein
VTLDIGFSKKSKAAALVTAMVIDRGEQAIYDTM